MTELGARLLAGLALAVLLSWYLLLAATAIVATAALVHFGWELVS